MDFFNPPGPLEFNDEHLREIEILEGRLIDECERRDLPLEPANLREVRGLAQWGREVPFEIDDEGNMISFSVSHAPKYNGLRYFVGGGGKYHDSKFSGMRGRAFEESYQAIHHFGTLLDHARTGKIPTDYFPAQRVWEIKHSLIPEIPGTTIVFQGIDYRHYLDGKNMLRVRRNSDSSVWIDFVGRDLEEHVKINSGRIGSISNKHTPRKMDELRRELGILKPGPEADANTAINYVLGKQLPEISPFTYHQIKSYESALRELPQVYQGPLKVIYEGSGVFEERS